MREVGVECEGVGRVWLVSQEGCASQAVALLSVINASGCGLNKGMKQLLQAKTNKDGENECDYVFKVVFVQPDGADEIWVMKREGGNVLKTRQGLQGVWGAREFKVGSEAVLVGQ